MVEGTNRAVWRAVDGAVSGAVYWSVVGAVVRDVGRDVNGAVDVDRAIEVAVVDEPTLQDFLVSCGEVGEV